MSHLTPEQKHVLHNRGTEAPFSGVYYAHDTDGMYTCADCGNALFSSDAKYDSGSGWPSYWDPASDASLQMHTDTSHGMARTEVVCQECQGHLGHVFDDGPAPTGKRYCINSAALNFVAGDDIDTPQ